MSYFDDLETQIKQYIKQNNNQEITGPILQNILLAMVAAYNFFLRKDSNDTEAGEISFIPLQKFFGGLIFGKNGFASGLTGFGGRLDDNGNGEMNGLTLRRWLEVPELRYNRVVIKIGDSWSAPGAGIIQSVDIDKDEFGRDTSTGTVTLKLEDGEYGAVAKGDICMGIFHSMKASDNASADSDDSRGNRQFAGFFTCYFTITEVSGDNNETFKYQLRPVSDRWTGQHHPCEAMNFVSYGSFTDTERQTSTYTTRTYTRRLWKQNTWEISAANIAMQDGDLSNLKIHGMDMTGYSIYLNSVYFTGTINQVKPDGTPVHTANDRGAWVKGHYDFYDRVSNDGRIWLCINENGTDSKPAIGNPDWLLQVDRGIDGADGIQGPKGEDGRTTYFHVKYADDAQGTNINDKSGAYIGTYVDFTQADSTDPKAYTWVKIEGAQGTDGTQGIPGKNGADGKTSYLHIKYSNDGGKTFTPAAGDKEEGETPGSYMGTYVDFVQTDSTDPSKYTWAKIEGPRGQTGIQGIQGEQGIQGIPGTNGKDGISPVNVGPWHTGLHVPYLGITRMGEASYQCIVEGGTDNPPLWNYTDNDSNRLQYNDGGYVLTGEVNTTEYMLLNKDGSNGINGTDGIPGKDGVDGKTYYTWLRYADDEKGNGISNNPAGKKFIGFAYNKDTPVESDNPADYKWSDIRGTDGVPGAPGKDGKTTFTWIAYSDNADGSGMYQQPKDTTKYIGIAVNKDTATESTNPKDYTWSLFKT